MKLPAFQFYPADWRKDAPLQTCSITARGVWHELMCVMHECEPYGHLATKGKAIEPDAAARLIGASLSEYRRAMKELEAANVFSVTAAGVIYSRRMVKDQALRTKRSECGKLGGNPNLLKQEVNRVVEPRLRRVHNQKPTPSASALKPLPSKPLASQASAFISPRLSTASNEEARANGCHVELKNTGKSKAKVNGAGQNWHSMAYVQATAITVNRPRRQGESDEDWTDAVRTAIERRMAEAKAETSRRK